MLTRNGLNRNEQRQFSFIRLIPLIFSTNTPDKTLAAYVALYLKEEVKEEGLVRDIGAFARFLEAISFSHGSILNLSNIARECHVSRKVVENYLSVIEDLLLGYKLSVFTKRARRAMTAQPKFYLFDAGVYYHLRPRGPLDSPDEIGGMALEGLVLQHLKAWYDYSDVQINCYFWRSRGGRKLILYCMESIISTLWKLRTQNKFTPKAFDH